MMARLPRTRSVAVAPNESGPDSDDLPAWLNALTPHVVVATYWLDPGATGKAFSAQVRFTGRRHGVAGRLQWEDRFDRTDRVIGILPGSGPVAITTTAIFPNPGAWLVTAEALTGGAVGRSRPARWARPVPNVCSNERPSVIRSLRRWGTPFMAASLPGSIETSRKSLVGPPGSQLSVGEGAATVRPLLNGTFGRVVLNVTNLRSIQDFAWRFDRNDGI